MTPEIAFFPPQPFLIMNVRELLTELNVPFKERGESSHVTTGWLGIVCPFCGRGTGKFGLGIHIRSLRVSCWKCGSHRLGDTLAAATDRHIREIMPLLPDVDPELHQDVPVPTGRYEPPIGVGPLEEPHRRYLVRRGFDPDEIAEVWGVQGIGYVGTYKWRLFIPLMYGEKPVSWTTRAIGDRIEQRYLAAPPHAESKPLKSCLYGENKCRHAIVVVEGPTDVWAIGPGAAATCGLTVTPSQRARISKYPVRVIASDKEPEAQRRANALADSLSVMPGETHVVRFSGKDPATSPRDEIMELRKRFLE